MSTNCNVERNYPPLKIRFLFLKFLTIIEHEIGPWMGPSSLKSSGSIEDPIQCRLFYFGPPVRPWDFTLQGFMHCTFVSWGPSQDPIQVWLNHGGFGAGASVLRIWETQK